MGSDSSPKAMVEVIWVSQENCLFYCISDDVGANYLLIIMVLCLHPHLSGRSVHSVDDNAREFIVQTLS